MSFMKTTNLAVVKNLHKGLSYIKGAAETFEIPFYSAELKKKGLSKKEFFKMLILIQEEERTRIGHELHDGVNPLLALAKLYLEMVPANSPKEKFAKEQICSVILSAIENIRIISSQLVISQKTSSSLIELIAELVKKINGIGLFKINFSFSREKKLNELCPEKKLVLYRIVQEQLNNVMKHSKAQHVEVKLSFKKENIYLSVQDDGVGFDVSKSGNGIGLMNITTRIKQFNGMMQIESEPGKGCSMNIAMPFV
ncbi:MAG TPA: sensor histidine kinase [Puia sp.]|nr:sensor histidine kinase [Puia sp.]